MQIICHRKINELAEKAKHDMEAKEELVKSLDDLVASRVNLLTRYYGNLTWQDFFQEGRIGLMIALDKYKRYYNGKERNFVTYSTYWIDKYIKLAYLQKSSLIRGPRNIEEDWHKIKNYIKDYINTNNIDDINEDIIEKLARVTNLSKKRIKKAFARPKIFFTDICPYHSEEDMNRIDDEIYYKEMARFFLSFLEEKEKDIIKMRFCDGLTIKEIGKHFGLSCKSIRKKIKNIKKKLSIATKEMTN